MRNICRRLPIASIVAAISAFTFVAGATGTPTVQLKARAVPIPVNPSRAKSRTYPGTGNILGAGAAVEAQFKISGTEYGGFPLPLTQVAVYLPAGAKIHPGGFATCPTRVLEEHEVQRCPKRSIASPRGEVLGVVSFGSTRVPEKATVQAFFTKGNGLAFFTEGRSPAQLEILSKGRFVGSRKPYGPTLVTEVPLVSTVPGAPYASVESIKVKVGAAVKKGKRLISYGTVPRTCPRGGFRVKSELTFLGGSKVAVTAKVPCPRGSSHKHHKHHHGHRHH